MTTQITDTTKHILSMAELIESPPPRELRVIYGEGATQAGRFCFQVEVNFRHSNGMLIGLGLTIEEALECCEAAFVKHLESKAKQACSHAATLRSAIESVNHP